jgi:hypothetical protein
MTSTRVTRSPHASVVAFTPLAVGNPCDAYVRIPARVSPADEPIRGFLLLTLIPSSSSVRPNTAVG